MRFCHSPVRSCAGAANIEPGRAFSGDEDSMLGHATPRHAAVGDMPAPRSSPEAFLVRAESRRERVPQQDDVADLPHLG